MNVLDMSYNADRSPRLHARLLGITVMWWPRPCRRWFAIKRGNAVLLVIHVGRLEILVG